MTESEEQPDFILKDVESTEKYLSENGIPFKTLRHVVTMTNEEMINVVKFEGEHAGAVLAKQLFMYDGKKKENMWLICAAVDTEVDIKALNKYLPCSSGKLKAADLGSLKKYLGCEKGLVNYFSIVNDTRNCVSVLVD